MTEVKKDYQAYLLRIWCAGRDNTSRWHAMLVDAHSGERMGFADLDSLIEFLQRTVHALPDDNSKGGDKPMS